MLNFLNKNLFWVLQMTGWGAFGLITVFAGGQDRHYVDAILLFIATVFSGLISTSILRWFLKRFIALPKFTFNKVVKVLGAVLTTSALWILLLFAFGFISGYLLKSWDIPKAASTSRGSEAKIVLFFFGFVMMCFWTGLYFGIKMLRKFNEERIERLELREQVRQAQLNTLKGHINAQFMVATLKKIKKLMLTDVPKSRAMLTELSVLLRYSLTKNNVDRVVLVDEIDMVKNYMRLTSLDHSDTLKVVYDTPVESAMKSVGVSPMLIVSLIEFFLKSSVLIDKSDGELVVKVALENNQLSIFLTSNAAFKSSKEGDFLRQKLEQRLNLLFKKSGAIDQKSNENGSSMKLSLPLYQLESNA